VGTSEYTVRGVNLDHLFPGRSLRFSWSAATAFLAPAKFITLALFEVLTRKQQVQAWCRSQNNAELDDSPKRLLPCRSFSMIALRIFQAQVSLSAF
jgi:hypothetical protein